MLRSTMLTGCLTVGLLMLIACRFTQAQMPAGQEGHIQAAPHDRAVKLASPAAKIDQGGRPLDEQKSAPVQIVTRDYDLRKLTHEPKVAATVFRGRVLWVQKCAFCHDGLGQPTYKTMGPWLDQDLVKLLTDEAIKAIIRSGTARMPGFQYGLSASQLDDLLNFLKTVPASAKPTPAQLAGRSEGRSGD